MLHLKKRIPNTIWILIDFLKEDLYSNKKKQRRFSTGIWQVEKRLLIYVCKSNDAYLTGICPETTSVFCFI